jgi:hypothetical protein
VVEAINNELKGNFMLFKSGGRIGVLAIVLILQGLNAFGQTNAVPPAGHPVARPEGQRRAAASKNTASVPAVPAQRTFSHRTEVQPADLATFRRIKEEGLLTPEISKNGRNTWAATESIFRSDNDQMGETCIRDTYVTIFPTGR